MTFFQMHDGFHSDPRVLRAGTAAFGLYARCGMWVADQLTDGLVPAELATLYGTREWTERLVAAGLWVSVDEGFMMPDYLEPHGNWTAERIRAHRAAAAERKAKSRSRQVQSQPQDMSQGESRVTGTGTHGESHASPSHPIPSHITTSLRSVEEPHDEHSSPPPDPTEEVDRRPQRDDVARICQHLVDRIAEDGSKRPPIRKTWLDAARLMLDKDGLAEHDIHGAIDWCQNDAFWRSNILSLPKLREKYDQLRKQAAAGPARAGAAAGRQRPASNDTHLGAAMERALAADAAAASQDPEPLWKELMP